MQWRAEHGATADDEVFLSRRAGQSADTRAMAYLVLSERGEHARALGQATRAYRDIADHLASRIDDWTTGLEAGRTGLTDQVKFAFSDALVTLALGGGGIYDGAYPTMYFSLTDTDAEVVSLVGTRTPSAVEFWLYNFSARRTVGVCLWRLPDGAGTLSFGPDTDQDGVFDRPPVERVLPRIRRGDRVPLSIPARTLQLVRVETTRPEVRDRSLLPDPAAAVADVRLPGDAVEVVVHNIGLAATGEFKVRLLDRGGQPLGGDRRLSLPGFTGMAPVTGRVRWQGVGADRVGWAVLDPDDRLEEVTEHNNRVPLPGVADHRPDRCQ